MSKISKILFLIFTILIGFISSLLIIFILIDKSKQPTMWIDFPPTKINGQNSKNENNPYFSSFFGSEFSNYSLYEAKQEFSPTDKTPLPNNGIANATFLGDLKNITNVVNDETTLNLWKKDVDHTQFVIYTKDQTIDKITLEIDADNFSNFLTVNYGWSTYIYSKGWKLPSKGVWTPDAITQEHTLFQPLKNSVYIAWISVRTLGQEWKQPEGQISLTTTVTAKNGEIHSQKNNLKINFIDNDYSSIAENYNEFAFLNNDQRLTNYYVQRDKPTDLPSDLNDESAYVEYSWKNYLKPTYRELKENNYFNHYTTFLVNVNGRGGERDRHQEATWDFTRNDPSLITWHRRKNSTGQYEIYPPKDEAEAFFKNLEQVQSIGIKNIFLRGFDGIKWYIKPDSQGRYSSSAPLYIYDDEAKELQVLDLALVNRENEKDKYGLTSFNYIQQILTWFVQELNNHPTLGKSLNFYLYFDELIEAEMKEFLKCFNELKTKDPGIYDVLKICYLNIYGQIDPQASYLDQSQLLYIMNNNFDNLPASQIFNSFLNRRESLGLKTSQYFLTGRYQAMPGYDYANHAFYQNYTGFLRTPGFLFYLLTPWTVNSTWTDLFATEKSGSFYTYPSLHPQSYVSKSVKLEMLTFGYNMQLKYQTLLAQDQNENLQDYFKNYQYLKVQNADYQMNKKLRYTFTPITSEKTYHLTKSPFLNWMIKLFHSDASVVRKIRINYQMVNQI